MTVHRRITALLAALTTMAGGSFVASASADADVESGERGAHPALQVRSTDHATAQGRHASDLAGALGISDDRLGTVLRELRTERRASDVVGARPAVRGAAELRADRADYAAALAAKVGVSPAVAAAALDGRPAAQASSEPATPAAPATPSDQAGSATVVAPPTHPSPATAPPVPVRPPSPPGT
ncbi:hypothetical protein AB0L40_24375 [Patulibacter sp. NPDC049589]|uniref:hypothetical protein n=1 Tax=Patulibacter sp. NPDC049589 TaxID=3154731 RepID=UPI003447FB44